MHYNSIKGDDIVSQTTLNVKLDSADKKRFEEFCSETGMNVSVAVNMFIKAVLRESRIPFSIECDIPNEKTLAAMEEGKKMKNDPNALKFSSVDELIEELQSE